MNYLSNTLIFLAIAGVLFACNKREIVPAPTQNVALTNRFFGKINNISTELTKNVNGYIGSSYRGGVFHTNAPDSVIYYSVFSSPSSLESLSIGHGCIITELETEATPPALPIFSSFYTAYANQTPAFSTNGINGLTVKYVDKTGKEWTSNQAHIYNLENAQYHDMSIKSDPTGDYATFVLTFGTYLYSASGTDSILLNDASYTGWYKR